VERQGPPIDVVPFSRLFDASFATKGRENPKSAS
jgi:hypothetical protein